MPLDNQQKKIIYITIGLIVILLFLIIFLSWQKNNLLNKNKFSQSNTQPTSTQLEFDTEVEKTEKQKLIEQIAPNTDLAQFDIPSSYLNKSFIDDPDRSPIFNRSGLIIDIDLNESSFTFLDTTFQEKIYKVFVDENTEISITTFNENYADTEMEILINKSSENKKSTLRDLKIDDNINIRAQQMINSDTFSALYISTNRIYMNIINN